MRVLLHDGTVDGLLSAVTAGAAITGEPVEIHAADTWHPSLLETPQHVPADPRLAGELLRELRDRAGPRAARRALYAALSEQPGIGTALRGYVNEVRRRGPQADGFLAHPDVARVHEAARDAGREAHRLKGLARFRHLRDGGLWAPIAPVHNVIMPLALYFKARMPGTQWMVHDVRRRLAVRWNGETLQEVDPRDLPPAQPALADDETAYQRLWQTYFRTIAVRERSNPRLQRQFMPVRYWEHLVEMDPRR
jgi:probable DNA metabolism protein